MTKKTKEIFEKVFNNQKNIMTPELVRYEKKWDTHIELSKGTDLDWTGFIFWVTIIKKIDWKYKRINDMSKMFYTLEKAEEYIEKI